MKKKQAVYEDSLKQVAMARSRNVYTDPDSDYYFREIVDIYKSSSTTEAATTIIKGKLEQLQNVTLNIAVTGMAEAGKSTLVNAIRGIPNNDPRAAPTGVTETTMSPIRYDHPTMPNVKIWDLPGIGTTNHQAKNFIKQKKFETYDVFIIITSERFKENDVLLAKAILKKKKLYYFVRSKIDNDIYAEQQLSRLNEAQVLANIRWDCQKYLRDLGNPKVFLISSFHLEKYDFPDLVTTLREDLPENKKLALIQSLLVYSMGVLIMKRKQFGKMIWLTAFGAGAIALNPVPGLSLACDFGILLSFFGKVHKAFGLDDESLHRLSVRVNKPVLEFKSAMTSQFRDGVNPGVLTKFLSTPLVTASATVQYVMTFFVGVGTLAAGGISVATVYHLLNKGIKEMEKDAKAVLNVAHLL
ncbi:interferon-inducible GTPase 5-like isoform X1 [Alosa pseudoharengus]|uniref:interferon-inducible GTPase 5-like isoform X1 n=1 Tax=Alosa pseudoharengus TaxID=34774 RepID=UPI003F8A6BD8